MTTYLCAICKQIITRHQADQQEHGHLPGCDEAVVCDCPPGWRHRPDCVLVTGLVEGRAE